MLRSFLIGLVAGMRAMTPLAAVSNAARRGVLPVDNGAPAFLGGPLAAAGTLALAAGELFGDKLPAAPDRIIAPGMAARIVTGALSGAALAPRDRRGMAAALGAVGAVSAAYVTFVARVAAMRRYGQIPTGFVEDAIVVAAALWIVGARSGARSR